MVRNFIEVLFGFYAASQYDAKQVVKHPEKHSLIDIHDAVIRLAVPSPKAIPEKSRELAGQAAEAIMARIHTKKEREEMLANK